MKNVFKKIISANVLCISILAFGICSAEDVQKPMYMSDWEYIPYQGQIKEINVKEDYIAISGIKVFLVDDFTYEGKKYMTSIKDAKGRDTSMDDLIIGKWVFVWGPGLRGDRIMAKDIYILSGALNDKDLRKYVQSSQKWDYQAVEAFAKKK